MTETKSLRDILQLVLGCTLPDYDTEVNRQHLEAWDSLKHIQLVLALEEAYGIQIAEENMAALDSLSAISTYIEEHRVP